MKLFQVYLSSLVVIFLSACVEYKEYPFPYDKNSTLDIRLSGTWEINNKKTDFKKLFGEDNFKEDKKIIIKFTPNKMNNTYTINTGESPIYNAYTSILKELKYINFAPETNPHSYNHYRYTIVDEELTVYMQNAKVLIEDIKNKKILGAISKNNIFPIIFQKPKSYKEYLLNNDSRLSTLPLYLTPKKENSSTQTPTSSK
jgi:hypothetical protein